MLYFAIALLIVVVVLYGFARLYLRGPDLSKYDRDDVSFFHDGGVDSSVGEKELIKFLAKHYATPEGGSFRSNIAHLRSGYEYQGRTRTFQSSFKPDTAKACGLEVPGEWTLPDGYDPNIRILFIHGGAFMVGSPLSHRPITDNIARRLGCAVFAPDYRLGPEFGRMAGIKDCQAAYKWVLENGPDGPAPAKHIGVSGDSAGGNLTLMILQYARDNGLRAPDAAVAMSPVTDNTGTSPSLKTNAKTDWVLGKATQSLNSLPHTVRAYVMWGLGKLSPAKPLASPIFGKLNDLAPTLLQVSNTEILYDDSRRYYQKARMAGSPVELQIWRGQAHVWQHYDEMIPEAAPALDAAADFFKNRFYKT